MAQETLSDSDKSMTVHTRRSKLSQLQSTGNRTDRNLSPSSRQQIIDLTNSSDVEKNQHVLSATAKDKIKQTNTATTDLPLSTKSGTRTALGNRRRTVNTERAKLTKAKLEDGAMFVLSEPPTQEEIEDHVELVFTNRFNKAQQYLKVTNPVEVTKPEIDALETMLLGGLIRGRHCIVSSPPASVSAASTSFKIINTVSTEKGAHTHAFDLAIPKSVSLNEVSARLVAEKLSQIFERLPFPEPRKGAKLLRIINPAATLALSTPGTILPNIAPSDKKDARMKGGVSYYYGRKFSVMDPCTGDNFRATLSLPLDKCQGEMEMEIPPLPDTVADRELKLHHDSDEMEEDAREQHKYAFQLVRYIMSVLHGRMGTKESTKFLMDAQKARFQGQSNQHTDPYGGRPLFQLGFEGYAYNTYLTIYPIQACDKVTQTDIQDNSTR